MGEVGSKHDSGDGAKREHSHCLCCAAAAAATTVAFAASLLGRVCEASGQSTPGVLKCLCVLWHFLLTTLVLMRACSRR